jgi:hypothetical protein
MKLRLIQTIVGVAVGLTVICMGAWLFLLFNFWQHPTVHPFFLRGLSQWWRSDAPAFVVVLMFWMMPAWVAFFATRVRDHWKLGRTGLLPALLMNASSVPVLAAAAYYFVYSGT